MSYQQGFTQQQGAMASAAEDAARHMPQQNMPQAAAPGTIQSYARAIPAKSGGDAEPAPDVFDSADVLTAGDGLSADLCGRTPPSNDGVRRPSSSSGSRPDSRTQSYHSRTPSRDQSVPDLVGQGAQGSPRTGEAAAAGLTGFDVNTSYATDGSGNNFSASSGGPVNVPINAPVLNAGGVKQ